MSEMAGLVEHVTCLGCGCSCDDIVVAVRYGRIAEARGACPLGSSWFGDGSLPASIRVRGADATIDSALDAAAATLDQARRALVFLSIDISCETQRAAVALADTLHGVVDGVSSSTVASGILAAQRRGRVSATLGEIRNRADCIVFWGTDPAARYPRYASRYAPEPAGLFVPDGRRGRTVVSVDIGEARGPRDADLRVRIPPDREMDAIAALRASLAGRSLGDEQPGLADLARTLGAARYAAIIYDAEPGALPFEPARAESLTALGQQLNATTRACVTPLRAGGNRLGAESVLTWQTGYPMTVDFSRGYPRYRPDDVAAALVADGGVDAVLVAGRPLGAPFALDALRSVVIGPGASATACEIAIDTGVAGIHESGTAFRMDDVPLPLRAPVPGPRVAAQVVRDLAQRIAARRARRS
ncbi:MAG: formylmethanofuran dehydrogenase subunit B [Gemmatimonadaceae bacterium]